MKCGMSTPMSVVPGFFQQGHGDRSMIPGNKVYIYITERITHTYSSHS